MSYPIPIANQKSKIENSSPALDSVRRALARNPFKPHPMFRSNHAQTVVGHAWPRRFRFRDYKHDEARFFQTEPDVQVLGHCRWQPERAAHPTLVLLHGLEGSSESIYMLGTAAKAFQKGFNVVRLNMRNCGGTEHLTRTLYNSGITIDLRRVVDELIDKDHLSPIFLTGFSMGGNIVLKLAGEYSEAKPSELLGVCAISPALDLAACAAAISRRSNRIYQQQFLRSLRRRIRHKHQLYPEIYDLKNLPRVHTIRDFDEHFTAVHSGYAGASDYYARASSLPLLSHIQCSTLIVHAEDDPFVPSASFRHPSITDNPHVVFLHPKHGGHVGFVARRTTSEDRFWMENRLVEFCRLVADEAKL